MRYGHLVAVDWAEVVLRHIIEMRVVADQLVAKEVIVDPLIAASAPLPALQETSVERHCPTHVVDWNGQMEGDDPDGHITIIKPIYALLI